MNYYRWVIVFFLVLSTGRVYPQTTNTDSLHASFARWFDTIVGLESTPIMNGELYNMTPKARVGHQFYNSRYFAPGEIQTTTEIYSHITIIFDIEHHLLILKHPDSTRFDGILTDQDDIKAFKIHGHWFQRFPDLADDKFFDVLFEGKHISLLALYSKSLVTEKTIHTYKKEQEYFIFYEGKLITFRRFGDIKKHFPAYVQELKELRKRERINFTTDDGNGRKFLIEELDALLNN